MSFGFGGGVVVPMLTALLAFVIGGLVVLITGHGHIAMAVKAMREGAYDFVEKPFTSERLVAIVRHAVERRQLALELRILRDTLDNSHGIQAVLIGRSTQMQQVRRTVLALADTSADVLIYGETGTGKELVARCLHDHSERRRQHFVPLNCGGLPEALAESELFGHEAGAFTSANRARVGKFEHANGGTLFLDEIESMPLAVQIKLLRALQERSIERVGGQESIRIDVRVLAATNRDLEALMKDGRFREDLYYRLNVVTVNLPSLRERRRDVPLLIEHLLAKYAGELGERGVAPDALDRLVGYDWPGNVRELENVIQRAMVMATSGIILPEHLPIGPVSAAASVSVDAPLEEVIERKLVECVRGLRDHTSANLYDLMIGLVEKPLLRAVLRETAGNQVRAAQILGINRNTLRKKLLEHGIDPGGVG